MNDAPRATIAVPKAPARMMTTAAEAPTKASVSCPDPIEGEWLALTYNPAVEDWYQVRLSIKRAAKGSQVVQGEVRVRFWSGDSEAKAPPGCQDKAAAERIVLQPARGTFAGDQLQFNAQSWSFAPDSCFKQGRYNLDNYSGRVDSALGEFHARNDDSGRARGEESLFRRVKCAGTET